MLREINKAAKSDKMGTKRISATHLATGKMEPRLGKPFLNVLSSHFMDQLSLKRTRRTTDLANTEEFIQEVTVAEPLSYSDHTTELGLTLSGVGRTPNVTLTPSFRKGNVNEIRRLMQRE